MRVCKDIDFRRGKFQVKWVKRSMISFLRKHSFGYKPSKDVLAYPTSNFLARNFGGKLILVMTKCPVDIMS